MSNRRLSRAAVFGVAVLTSAVSLGACASTPDNLQRETARHLGVPVANVSVTDVSRGLMSVDWQAHAAGQAYACSADDMVRRVHCTPIE
jgi:hypothetical protein